MRSAAGRIAAKHRIGGGGPPHPASYYTGPLGANNVLPATADGALMAIWSGFTGGSLSYVQGRIATLETAIGRQLDVIGVHIGGGSAEIGQADCGFFTTVDPTLNWVISHGSVPMVTWTPDRGAVNANSLLSQINAGLRDGCIDAAAAYFAAKGVRIMLRPFHEFDLGRYHARGDSGYDYGYLEPWLTGQNWTTAGQAVATAWQRIVTRFQAAGASNVGFYWCPIESYGRTIRVPAYPGDTYVDWVGSDTYNSNSGYSTCVVEGWATFEDLFNYKNRCGGAPGVVDDWTLYDLVSSGKAGGSIAQKPYFVGETSTRYDSGTPTRKNTFYSDIAKTKDPTDANRYMPRLIGVSVFDHYIIDENNSDWRIDSNQTAAMATAGTLGTQAAANGLDGWVTWGQTARWRVGVA